MQTCIQEAQCVQVIGEERKEPLAASVSSWSGTTGRVTTNHLELEPFPSGLVTGQECSHEMKRCRSHSFLMKHFVLIIGEL